MAVLQVVVTGGAGQIAYSLIPLIARGLVFGPATRVHLRLLDIPPAVNALEGELLFLVVVFFSLVKTAKNECNTEIYAAKVSYRYSPDMPDAG